MKKLLIGMAMSAVVSAAFADGTLTGFEVNKVGEGLTIKVNGEGLGKPKVIRANAGKSYMLEFDAKLVGKSQYDRVGYAGIEYVRAGWYSARPAKVRLHVRMDANTEIGLKESEAGWVLQVTPGEETSGSKVTVLPQPTETGTSKVLRVFTDAMPTVPAPTVKVERKPLGPSVEESFVALDGLPDGLKEPKTKTEAKSAPKAEAKAPVKTEVKVINHAETKHNYPAPQNRQTIDLEFVNADVVQVLRAIAMQSDVNIVTAPDVKGTVTVSLQNVSVSEALNLVTALAGLSYSKVNNTFVVAGNPSVLRKFSQGDSVSATTRVVPIYSGEGLMIKTAVLKSVPSGTGSGGFEIVLPSEEISLESKGSGQNDSLSNNTGTEAGSGANGERTNIQTKGSNTDNGKSSRKDTYVMLIGPASRLEALEQSVKAIDQQLCLAHGIEVPASNMMVRRTYMPKGTKAGFLLMAVSGQTTGNPSFAKVGTVEMYATPITSVGEQAITLYGRGNEVDRIIENLQALDSTGSSADQFQIYEVQHLDPRGVKQELENQFPGLQVSVVPASAGAPGLFKEQEKKESASGNSQTSESKSQSSSGTVDVKTDDGSLEGGITLPFSDSEKQAYTMRLVIRGSQTNVSKALDYLKMVDVAPKQLALELRVMDFSREDALRVGIDWGALTSAGVNMFRVNQGLGDTNGTPGTAGSNAMLPGGKSLSVTGTLDQIANDRNLIARPNLFAYDGRQAELFVGDIIRYIESIQATQNGITVTTKELPVGVRLAVLPRIGGNNQITMDLRPVVSTLNGFTSVPGGGQLPQTSLRIAQNTVTMEDGETIAIGGLIQENDVKRNSGIPLLKDLPIIGKLFFSRTDNSKRRTELVFFLTAKLVNKTNRTDAANPTSHGPNGNK